MPSFEIIGSRFAARLTYNLSQDISGNYSVIRITKVELKSLQSMPTTECWVKGSISVNGGNACTLELTDSTSCSVTMSQSYDGGGEGNGWFSGFSTRDVVIGHGEDGNGGFSVYASLDVIMTNQVGLDPGIRNSAYVGLPQIPRVSSLSTGGVVLGQEMTIRISRASSAFSDTVTWRCGSRSGTIADRTTAAELKWTPAVDLAAQAPNSTTVSIELTIQTFVNGSQVGSRATNVNCTVPGWVVPTVSAVVSDRMGYANRYGGYVQSQSQARIVTTAAGVYGSSIRSIAVRCGGLTGSGADVSFALGESGQLPVTVTVTDSRGRTAQWSSSINVLSYRKPQVTVTQAYRCDSQGNQKPDGDWLRVIFNGSVTALTGNGATYRGICRVHGGTGERSVLLADYTGQTTVTGGSFLLTAGLDTGYDCSVTVQDNFSTVESGGSLVSIAFALLDFDRQNKAVGIGMRAKNPGKVSIGLDVNMEEHRLGNLLDPSGSRDAATKAYVDRTVKSSGDKCVKYDDCLTLEEIAASTALGGKVPQASGVRELLDRVTLKELTLSVNGLGCNNAWWSAFLVGNLAFISCHLGQMKVSGSGLILASLDGYRFTKNVKFSAGFSGSQPGAGYTNAGTNEIICNFPSLGGDYAFGFVVPVEKM